MAREDEKLRPTSERRVARALIVGCGCRGRELGRRLAERLGGAGHDPRPGARRRDRGGRDRGGDRRPRPGRHGPRPVADVAIVCWLLGSAEASPRRSRRSTARGSSACSRSSSTRRFAASSTRRPGRSRPACSRRGRGRSRGARAVADPVRADPSRSRRDTRRVGSTTPRPRSARAGRLSRGATGAASAASAALRPATRARRRGSPPAAGRAPWRGSRSRR